MSIELHQELTELRRAILTMAAGVEQRVGRAVRALIDDDPELARVVRKGDSEIDQMEVDIEAECLRILALTHPVAGDLRFVLSVMRVNTDLERIADIARGVAKRVMHMHKQPGPELPTAMRDMGLAVRDMVGSAIQALANEDPNLARLVRRRDDRVDDLQSEVKAWVQEEIPGDVEALGAYIDMLSIARRLERIGDLATNIAEDVVFLTEGQVIRHTEEV